MLAIPIYQLNKKTLSPNKSLSFGRELTPIETINNRCKISDAKKALGLEHLVLITHTPSLPSELDEDNGIGIFASTKGTLSYLNFAYNNGIDGISIEPPGIIKAEYYCPYDSSSFSKKIVVDLNELTTDKWANILPSSVAKDIIKNKNYKVQVPQKDAPSIEKEFSKDRVIYDYILPAQIKALKIAYNKFQSKLNAADSKTLELNKKFNDYKKENNYWLEKDSLYYVLSNINGSDYYKSWDNEIHRTLFDDSDKSITKKEKEAEKRNLIKENKEEINFYKFCQFVINEQQKEITKYASTIGRRKVKEDMKTVCEAYKKSEINQTTFKYLIQFLNSAKEKESGIKIIGDRQIGFSTIDIWGNPTIFTEDEFMGAPANPLKKRDAQAWGFKFIKREQLFDTDDSLKEGGIFLKNLFVKTFRDNPGGIRIDHILGMIDPWTYKLGSDAQNSAAGGSRYLFKLMLNNQLSELKDLGINEETIKSIADPIKGILVENSNDRKLLMEKGITDFEKAEEIINANKDSIKKEYSKILEKIVLSAGEQVIKEKAAHESKKLTPEEINKKVKDLLICEDLGVLTLPLIWTMKDLGLTGMRHARYSDPLNAQNVYREINPEEQGHYWTFAGADDAPYTRQVNDYNNQTLKKGNKTYCARDLHADYISQELNITNTSPLKDRKNPWPLTQAKFARMVAADKKPETPNNILLMWTDLIAQDVQYNKPGRSDKELNWNARVPNSSDRFDKTYYNRTLPDGKGISISESLTVAMKAMSTEFIHKNQELINSLSDFAQKLREKPE